MRNLPPFAGLFAFEAAASEFTVTPTTINHQIRLMERFRGFLLFRRRPRKPSSQWTRNR
jgi:DNA-binding transcriptional LysR family regulator